MAKITILEKDLTKAAFQATQTDIAFVPGFSVKDDATLELTYCTTISDFEEKFGTCPRMLYETVVVSNNEDIATSINLTTYTSLYKKGITLTCKEFVENNETVLKWVTIENGREVVKDLAVLGITITSGTPVKGNTLTVVAVYDLSYVYAKELLMSGMPIIYKVIETENIEGNTDNYSRYSAEAMSKVLKNSDLYDYNNIDGIMDKGEYSVKYITSGFYPSFIYEYDSDEKTYDFNNSFSQKMITLAKERGDCVALIDPTPYEAGALPYIFTDEEDRMLGEDVNTYYISNTSDFSYLGDGSLWQAACDFATTAENLEYGSMFSPWAVYKTQATYYYGTLTNTISDLSKVTMPPSFGYLQSVAKSIRTNGNWLAVAGTSRGVVPYFVSAYTLERLSNYTADQYQPRNGKTSINAITNIKPYGYTVWGNRTMKNNELTANGGTDGLTASSFLNIRNMLSDIKKTAYNAAKQCMFEQNSGVLWVNFCAYITPLLDKLVSGQGLSNYKIIKQPTNEKAKLKATIVIYPLYAIEDFEITIELSDQEVTVE